MEFIKDIFILKMGLQRIKMQYFKLIILLLMLISCSTKNKTQTNSSQTNTLIKYAKGFDIEEFNGYHKLTIRNIYKGSKEVSQYYLVKNNTNNFKINDADSIIQIPVKKVVATSTTHIPMIEALEEENSLVGFPNTNYVSSPNTRELIDNGAIKEVGMDANLNTEVIIDLNPDLIIGFSVNTNNKSLDALKRLGIDVIYNGAWLEETPLGRAEWIKFFGVLFDKKEMADSIFSKIEEDYIEIKKIAFENGTKSTIISGSMFKDVWNLPAGESFAAQILNDANTNYLWKDSKGTGSLQLNFENVLDKGQMADLWIDSGSYTSKKQLLNSNALYAEFKAFKTNNIYTFSKTKGPTGGTIFYELGALRPDLILKDIIKICHPELLTNEDFTFFDRLD